MGTSCDFKKKIFRSTRPALLQEAGVRRAGSQSVQRAAAQSADRQAGHHDRRQAGDRLIDRRVWPASAVSCAKILDPKIKGDQSVRQPMATECNTRQHPTSNPAKDDRPWPSQSSWHKEARLKRVNQSHHDASNPPATTSYPATPSAAASWSLRATHCKLVSVSYSFEINYVSYL